MIELIGGLLILAGFQTRPAAFLTSGTMAVAYFPFHRLPRRREVESRPVKLKTDGFL